MFSKLLSTTFGQPSANPKLFLIQNLKQAHPGSQSISIIACQEGIFPLHRYLKSKDIPVEVDKDETHETFHYKHGSLPSCYTMTIADVSRFNYESVEYIAYKATWQSKWQNDHFYHLVFDSQDNAPGKELARAVYQWANSPKEEVWVYEEEIWKKSEALYKDIRSADWDSIVLKDDFREQLRSDVGTFFNSREAYASLNVTWKRGILLLGPPGNGKTESIKALLNEFKHMEALYVKSNIHRAQKAVFAQFFHMLECMLHVSSLLKIWIRWLRTKFVHFSSTNSMVW